MQKDDWLPRLPYGIKRHYLKLCMTANLGMRMRRTGERLISKTIVLLVSPFAAADNPSDDQLRTGVEPGSDGEDRSAQDSRQKEQDAMK
jgi:hypothetical protein